MLKFYDKNLKDTLSKYIYSDDMFGIYSSDTLLSETRRGIIRAINMAVKYSAERKEQIGIWANHKPADSTWDSIMERVCFIEAEYTGTGNKFVIITNKGSRAIEDINDLIELITCDEKQMIFDTLDDINNLIIKYEHNNTRIPLDVRIRSKRIDNDIREKVSFMKSMLREGGLLDNV